MYKYILSFFFLLFFVHISYSQDLLKGNDLSQVKIDQLTDAEIINFQQQYQSAGLTLQQVEQMASSKKMQPNEISKLHDRLMKIGQATVPAANTTQQQIPQQPRSIEKSDYKTYDQTPRSNVFGSSFFTTPSLSFEPNLRIATPSNYSLGPDDELLISVSGYQETTLRLQVQPEGTILIPQVGVLNISGLSIEAATSRILLKMSQTAYPTLKTGQSKLNVSLGKIRSILITVIGAAKPGNYTVSSLSTVFNSIYQSGGPDAINSFREIELRRNHQVIKKIDLYQFLTKGDEYGNVLLKENDVINFPVYKTHVTINGEVKRPGVFELKPGETLDDLLFYAGGFTDKGYKASIKAKQITDTERRVKDIPKSEYGSYQPSNGDEFQVDAVLNRLENQVSITGAVYRAGQFELTAGLTISGLIKKAGGLMEDVYTDRALLVRTGADRTKQTIRFNINSVLNGGTDDIQLLKNDEIYIASASTFKSEHTVSIEGEVRKPGSYPYSENLSLKDLLFLSGSFTDAASTYHIEVGRRLINDNSNTVSDSTAKVFETDAAKVLNIDNTVFPLKPFDIVSVRKNPGYTEQQRVKINGEVNFPGTYTLQTKNDRVSDLLKRAGGFTSSAYSQGVFLTRKVAGATDLLAENALSVQRSIRDTSQKVVTDITTANVKIAIDADKILKMPGSPKDYVLLDGDEIEILKSDPLVKVSGEVLLATKTSFIKGGTMFHYLSEAGGTTENARRSKIYVLYPNGEVDRTHNYILGLFRTYPRIRTGSEIIVPRKQDKTHMSTSEIVALAGTVTSLASLIIITINSLTK